MGKFNDFKLKKEAAEFENKFNILCEEILSKGVKFENYWKEAAVPVLNEQYSYNNESELLNEFLDKIRNWWKGLGKQNSASPAVSAPEISPERAEKLAAFQKTADEHVEKIKQRFAVAMKDFLKATTDDAVKSRDPHMYKIAQSFYNKIIQSAQPTLDSFKMVAKFGRGEYEDEFSKRREGFDKTRKSQLQQRFPQNNNQEVPPVQGGPVDPSPSPSPDSLPSPLNRVKGKPMDAMTRAKMGTSESVK